MPRPRKLDHPNFGITRMDYQRNRGWWVRLYDGVKLHQKSFADSSCGGKRKGLQSARAWRDVKMTEINPDGHLTHRGGRKPSLEQPLSMSGYAGVQLLRKRVRGRRYYHWVAIRFDHCKRISRSFSCLRYGYRGAYLWAVYTRARWLDEEVDLRRLSTPKPDPVAKRWLEERGVLRSRTDYGQFSDAEPE